MKVRIPKHIMRLKIRSYSITDPCTGCWNWNKGMLTVGYGSAFDGEKNLAAHKASYEAFYGEIPRGVQHTLVLHKCGNRKCVNPEHLYLGTKKDNTYDALTNGAFKGRTILSKDQRLTIKSLFNEGFSMRDIAKMYNTNHPQISRVIKEKDYAFS